MKNFTMFNYNFLFCDHFAKLTDQAKLYYIKLNFYADNGFVPNPLQVCDSLGYSRDVLDELIANGDILTIPNRNEVFITTFFVHNKGANRMSWTKTPFAPYWRGKLFIKQSNGVATFTPQGEEQPILPEIKTPNEDRVAWDETLKDIESLHKN